MKDYEYFTSINPYEIYIEEREGWARKYVVWENNSIIQEGLNKRTALTLANRLRRESREETNGIYEKAIRPM